MLDCMDGLYHLDDEVTDLASSFFTELKKIGGSHGEDVVEKLVPHITVLMTKLDTKEKLCGELKFEVDGLQHNLQTAETKFNDLNLSYKNKCDECNAIEDDFEVELVDLKERLSLVKQENVILRDRVNSLENSCSCSFRLKDSLDPNVASNTNTSVTELEARLSDMATERARYLTTIQVLEADIEYLKNEIVRLEEEVGAAGGFAGSSDLMDELSKSMVQGELDAFLSLPPCSSAVPAVSVCPELPADGGLNDFRNCLLIGDSIVRHAGKKIQHRGARLECCPGAKIQDIKQRLLELADEQFSVIYVHVGTNNLRRGYRGGPGYNGGHGKRQTLHSMADLLYNVRARFPNSKIFVNSVLIRSDINYKALFDFNDQLDLMCNNFGVRFVEANCSVGRRDLARDGRHLNRRGVSRLAALFESVFTSVLNQSEVSQVLTSTQEHTLVSPDSGAVTCPSLVGDRPEETLSCSSGNGQL